MYKKAPKEKGEKTKESVKDLLVSKYRETAYTIYFYPSQTKIYLTEKDLHQYKINPCIIVFHIREMLSSMM